MAKVRITAPVHMEPFFLGYAPGEIAELTPEMAKKVIEAGRGVPEQEKANKAIKADGPETREEK